MNNYKQLTAALFAGISVVAIFGALNHWRYSQEWNEFFVQEALPVDDRLLGHYPYPEAAEDDLATVEPGLRIHKDAYKALLSMRAAANDDGVELIFLSGFRTHEWQKKIFFAAKSDKDSTAIERAGVSAPPGYSEHSTGYAIDLGDGSRSKSHFEIDFESTEVFRWLQDNASKFGFVLSFPKANIQGVSYQPWHWRFEGTEKAKRQFKPANSLTGRQR